MQLTTHKLPHKILLMSEVYSKYPAELSDHQKHLAALQLQDSVRWNHGAINTELGTFSVRKIRNAQPFDSLIFNMWSARFMDEFYRGAFITVAPEGDIEVSTKRGVEV